MSDEQQEKSFAELFEDSEMSLGQELKVGARVQGKILQVGKEQVYVDTGTKTDGVADIKELLDDEGRFPYQEGDQVDLFVVSKKGNEIRLARSMGREGGLEELEQAQAESIPVEGRVKETCKGGFRVQISGRTAFCPLSQIDVRPVDDPESMVGQTLTFLINRIEERGRNIVVSRRSLLEKEQAQALESFTAQTSLGDVVQGTVTRLAPFGAFVQVAPGLEGLVHISEMSWSRSLSPEEIVSPGDLVTVKLLSLEDQGKGKVRMELSMKQTQTDPWDEVSARFTPGTLVTGTVTRTAPFGAFVEIEPGIEGLVHISEMSYLKRVHKPEDEVSPGDEVSVSIKDIDQDKKRIGLSMRDAEGDPWVGLEDRYSKGQTVQGVAEKREPFGLFVKLEPGVVGLLPKSKLDQAPDNKLQSIKAGEPVSVSIESIDHERRRISLAPAEGAPSEDWKSYTAPDQGLTSLGDKLKQALNDKERS